jgi:hypothetical protein
MTREDFRLMLDALAHAWSEKDYERAASFFADRVAYADPLRYTLDGREQLLQFFRDDGGYEQHTTWHQIVFDELRQLGAVEYTYVGTYRYHGVVMVKTHDGLITHWREYQHTSDRNYEEFAGPTLFPSQS